VPSMWTALLQAKSATRDHFSSLRYPVSGGEPLPGNTAEDFERRFGLVLNEGYGLTEASPVVNWCHPRNHKRFSVGPPLPGIEQQVIGADGRRVAPGAEGEVRIKGPNVMRGYYRLEEETAAAFDDEGWLKTGDIGRIDADGHLFITGRPSEMIVIAGENVFPRTIEEALDDCPGVRATAVLGMRDPVRGEIAVAFVEPAAGAAFDEARLRAHCRERLAPYQVPRRIVRIERMPRSPAGKILRGELRALLEGGG